mmetsp:Transcript_29941/g.71333  ORF Transcript_29941/g.71333 Transcript_29941/m.71333 type:complete len:382 (-) Transcript_29941:300-1445(-)
MASRFRQKILAAVTQSVRLVDTAPKEVVDDIFQSALKKQIGVSLKYMLDFGSVPLDRQMMLSAQFLHKELPVRLAHRVTELENLPYGLSTKPQILKVRDWYVESFTDLRSFPAVKDLEDELKFTDMLRSIYKRHMHVVPMMAAGVASLKEELSMEAGLSDYPEIHQFLDGFYMSRIGIRILIGQHISLHSEPREGYVGMICTNASPLDIAEAAIADARDICIRQYGSAPDVDIYGVLDMTFPYVPEHLHHMLFELLKNSLRAVNDRYEESDEVPPNIRVVIADGMEDVTIKVSDEGGGIPRSGVNKIWTYLYTTGQSPVVTDNFDPDNTPAVLAGYGYGLPISRLYARYFGGDLQIISMEGYGTDAYLHLHRLGNYQEPLP